MTARPKRRFRPTLWATVAVVPVFALLVGLGVWQLQRMEWKNALVAEMQGRMTAPAIALPRPLEDTEGLRFRRVELTGTYLHDKALYRAAQTLGKNRRGWHVITPMRLEDGRTVLVNRGYVPTEKKPPETRPESLFDGPVTIEGVLRLGGWSGMDFVRPENDPADNVWVWMDLPRMAEAAGLENAMTEVYVDAAEGQHPADYPVGGQTRVNLRNQHLEYALTWFLLAAGLLGVYFLYHWRPERTAGDEAE
jgi:surfeit locus 1 family protein